MAQESLNPNNPGSFNQLWVRMYKELHALAHQALHQWQPGRTLNTTALAHECYLKLRLKQVEWQDQKHFYRIARKAMRELIIDFARKRGRKKRGDGALPISLEDATRLFKTVEQAEEVLAIHEGLERYGKMGLQGERGVKVVEYVYFMGLTRKETAELLGISTKTVQRDFDHFRAWFLKEYASV